MDFTDVYSEKIIEIAGNLPVTEPIAYPDAHARKTSRVCGSAIEVDLKVRDGIVSAYAHDVSACAMGQTSASVVGQNIVGAGADEMRVLRETMIKMLKEGGPPPVGRFADLKYLQPVADYPARHASTLLVFDAVIDCLDQIERKVEA